MEERKLIFITPDISAPAGGIKVIYQTVDMLNELGFNAFIMHSQRYFRCKYSKGLKNLKYIFAKDTQYINSNDILFVPEPDVLLMNEMAKMHCKKVVFNQNWAYTFNQFRLLKDVNKTRYQDLGINDVLTVTEKIKDYLELAMPPRTPEQKHLNVGVVSPYLSDIFTSLPLKEKKLKIAFMPRKNFNTFQEIYSILFNKYQDTIVFEMIDNKSEAEVAAILKESAIFLSMGFPEGFSLPPLEAMKSGCLVIGYSGYGGLEYMTNAWPKDELRDTSSITPEQGNMFIFPDGDVVNMAKKISEVWDDFKNNKNMEYYQEIANQGITRATGFTREESMKKLNEWVKQL